MNRITGYTLGAVFLAAVAATGYEAYKLNELVWSAPEIGDVTLSRGGKEGTYTIDLERNESLISREDFAKELNIYFHDKESPETPTQICLRTSYELAGIFTPDPESELLQKYIEDNPTFKDFTLENIDPEELEINNRISFYTHKPYSCSDEAIDPYKKELQAVVDARRRQLGLN